MGEFYGLKPITPSRLASVKLAPKWVQDLLGRSSVTVILDLYTVSLDDLGCEAVESLDVESRSPISGS